MPVAHPTLTDPVGVLALQGAFRAHADRLGRIGANVRFVRTPADLDDVRALVMPGGESTTMSNLLVSSDLFDPIGRRLRAGMPTLGTCAGMILLASQILDGRPDQRSFGVLDITVRRNGFGRQIDSFESPVDLDVSDPGPAPAGAHPFPGVFIRAPRIESVGPDVVVVARLHDEPVLVRQGPVMAASFHPELTDDTRVHEVFMHLASCEAASTLSTPT